ncbi:alpha/beta fold hydrolase [Pseudomonadales bacterium]|nr:alpha/beta fold hydrolase [Pseudomonadales bacterium]
MRQNSPEGRALQVQNGDVSIHVNIYGDPVKGEVSHYPVILCVHGWPEHSHSWRHQVKFFVNHGYTVATMDVRGYGNSSKPDHVGGYTLESLALDVACVAAAVSDQPVVLFGHDGGGTDLLCHNLALSRVDLRRGRAKCTFYTLW